MSTITGSSINDSPTVVFQAGTDIEEARAIALAVTDGKLVKPEAGANVIGLSIAETEETLEAGEMVDVQIKDIGEWIAAEAISTGDELAADADGKAAVAREGDFIVGIALSNAEKAGTWVKVQITKSGYKHEKKKEVK